MNSAIGSLLQAVRRRLRVAWALATLQLLAPLVAGVCLVLVVSARYVSIPWAEPGALVVAGAAILAVAGWAALRHLSDQLVARAADRGLATKDAFATSLELHAHGDADDDDLTQRVHRRAAELAAALTPAEAVRYRLHRRPVALAAILAPAALVLAFVANPQDAAREQRRREAAAIGATVDVLEQQAEQLRAQPGGEEAAKRLEQLAKVLAKTDSLDKATEKIDEAADELRQQAGDDLLAKKAATEGLQRNLDSNPLPGAQGDQSIAEQLEALREQLPGLTSEQQQEVAQRLEDLAATQEAGDPATAQALDEAASALAAGDVATAQAKLGEAAAASAAAAGDVAAQAASGEAADAAANAADRLQGRPATGSGQSAAGSGSGSGSGKGSGSGSGKGSGSGSGSGSGNGGTGGSPSGNVSGCKGCSPGNGGKGGKGNATGSSGGTDGQSPDTDSIFDPVHGSGGDTGTVGGGSGSGDGGTIGKTNGQTNSGTARVPLSDAIVDYTRTATDAMDNPSVPPSTRTLVLTYFDQLQGR